MEDSTSITEIQSASKPVAVQFAESDETEEQLLHYEGKDISEIIEESSIQEDSNQTLFPLDSSPIGSDMQKSVMFSEMEAELEIAASAILLSQKQIRGMQRQLSKIDGLEIELLAKILETDYLRFELKQAKELNYKFANTVRKNELSQVKLEKEMNEKLERSKNEVCESKSQLLMLKDEIQRLLHDLLQSSKREVDLEVEIAVLKSEIHKARSRIAAAEAAEARAMSLKNGFSLAVHQLAFEAEEAKKDKNTQLCNYKNEVTISLEEYETLIKKSDETTKKELESAENELRDLKIELEEAVRRAEMAEKAKSAVEEQLRKWRKQQQQQKRDSKEENKEEIINNRRTHMSLQMNNEKIVNFVPLSKMLNMKF